MFLRTAIAALALCLGGCKVGAGDDAGSGVQQKGCIGSFLGGSVQNNTSVCSMCRSAGNARRAIDGIRETSADYAYGSGSTAGVSVRAQAGIVFPAGRFAGALMAIPPEYTGSSWTIATLLDGVPQETLSPANDAGGDLATPSGLDEYYGFITTAEFDEVRVTMNGGAAGIEPPAFRIYEFCGDR